ncbi:TerB family tellurite resistance protein [Aestuariibius sp. HNIBRBA575]|uniref:tellurite resistance TerB family protein n=1 Tax=Aestuariibius sp. HNIBRBA575 TaxID=3233343 RepID=UPI0034A1D8B0
MFERLLSHFKSDPLVTPMAPEDAQHALGALLVRIAKADKAYLFQEIEQIDKILMDRFDLNPLEAARMRASCEKLETALPSTKDMAAIITRDVSEEDREAMVRAMWVISVADGQKHSSEEDVVAMASEAFGVAPERVAALLADVTG